MAELLKTKSLNYSDVNLIAKKGKVNSRKEIPIEGWRIVVSAMSSIVGPSFIKAASELSKDLQPTIHIPRDIFQGENLAWLVKNEYSKVFIGVGFKTTLAELKFIDHLGFNTVVLDVANGYMPKVIDKVKELKDMGFLVCTGSVHSEEGYIRLKEAGVDIVRAGIGSGFICITADNTGYTRGTFTEIFQMRKQMDYMDERGHQVPDILADGGFIQSGDFVKSFLAGAEYCMSGKIFQNVNEARMYSDGYGTLSIPMHTYFGMASEYGKICMGSSIEHIEGRILEESQPSISLEKLLTTLWEAIRSGISYSGYDSLTNAIGNGIFESKV